MCLETECPNVCKTFPTRNNWLSHLALDHRLEPDWASLKCPLCRHETGSGKITIISHFNSHLEEIALAALPIESDWDESSAKSNRYLESEGDDPPFAVTVVEPNAPTTHILATIGSTNAFGLEFELNNKHAQWSPEEDALLMEAGRSSVGPMEEGIDTEYDLLGMGHAEWQKSLFRVHPDQFAQELQRAQKWEKTGRIVGDDGSRETTHEKTYEGKKPIDLL